MALAFRVFYAFSRGRSLTTADGKRVDVPYGSAQFVHKLITEYSPDYLALVCDTEEKTFRHQLYLDYKANRGVMPDSLQEQLSLFFELFVCLDIKLLALPGYEADDIIGTLATKFKGDEIQTLIVSSDKDFMQLVEDGHTHILNKDYQILGSEDVHQRFQCRPDQIIDCLALMGDSSDNVPGVKGIGVKTAGSLIAKFGSLTNIYENIAQVTPHRVQKNLLAHKEDALLSQKLVTIDTDVPITTQLQELVYEQQIFSNRKLYEFYRRLEFKKLLLGFDIAEEGETASSWLLTKPRNTTELAKYLQKLVAAKQMLVVVSPSSDDVITAVPQQIVLGETNTGLCCIDLTVPDLNLAAIRPLIAPLLADKTKIKIGYGLKSALKILPNAELELGGELVDVLIYDYLLNPNFYDHSLKSLSERYLQIDIDTVETERQGQIILDLVTKLQAEVAAQGMGRLAEEIEMPLIRVLAEMERHGIFLDTNFLHEYATHLEEELLTLKQEIYALSPREFNINSPQQLQQVLFVDLKIHKQLNVKNIRKTKTGYSTNESMLTKLSGHPLPRLILKYRELAKLKNTYVDALPKHVHPHTKRLHTNFRQDVAATGRLSSDNPNLQNIPMRTVQGKKIRSAFTPQSANKVIVSADYSQIEIRLLADMADAHSLITAFNKDMDIHRLTAAQVFNIEPEEVTDIQRSHAKAINFGIIYGMGPQKLARTTSTSLAAAKEFIARYMAVYPEIKNFTSNLIAKARAKGYSQTPQGRRREIIGIDNEHDPVAYAHACNMAINSCIQGYAADLIKIAMIRVSAALTAQKLQTRMLLQIHDELVFECPLEELQVAKKTIKNCMENAVTGKIKFKVDIRWGQNWLELGD